MPPSEVEIAEMALSRVGVSREFSGDVDGTLASCTDATEDKAICERWYERCRNRSLEGFPWTFARAYTTLTLADDGDGEVWEEEWDNAYTYPTACLRIRRFVSDVGYWDWGFYSPNSLGYWMDWRGADHWRYVVRLHDSAKVILTNVEEADADIEFTQLITDTSLFTEQYASALAWMLAAEIAVPLSVDLKRRDDAVQMFAHEMRAAAANMLNEETDEEQPDGNILRARGWW